MSEIDRFSEIDRIVASACNAHTADGEGFTGWSRTNLIALAQVHATAALAEAQEKAVDQLVEHLPLHEGGLSVAVFGSVGVR